MPKRKQLEVNSAYGFLTVVSDAIMVENRPMYPVRCRCGNTKLVRATKLLSGHTVSCGCVKAERFTKHATKHGGHDEPEYAVWQAMRQRCGNPDNRQYADYGGRGIVVDPRWDAYSTFIADMGKRPSDKHMLERIDNSKGYSKANCKWASRTEQNSNTRKNVYLEFRGLKATMAAWADACDLYPSVLSSRRKRGLPIEQVLREVQDMPLDQLQKELTER